MALAAHAGEALQEFAQFGQARAQAARESWLPADRARWLPAHQSLSRGAAPGGGSERAGTCFPSTPGTESYRLTNHALRMQTPETLCAVIDLKTRQWGDTERARYLRSATLFAPEKLENYLSEVHQRRAQAARHRPSAASRAAQAVANHVPGSTPPTNREPPPPNMPPERLSAHLDKVFQALGKSRTSVKST
ncbi:conserved phage C-terminal domain-containing protein [Halochromatium salexigens]|uniref:conserved phage C-terminal domain-containing protein n=1 Tax=Halochromatium salexigens TaxID=49447 RepID=UPI0030B82C70